MGCHLIGSLDGEQTCLNLLSQTISTKCTHAKSTQANTKQQWILTDIMSPIGWLLNSIPTTGSFFG